MRMEEKNIRKKRRRFKHLRREEVPQRGVRQRADAEIWKEEGHREDRTGRFCGAGICGLGGTCISFCPWTGHAAASPVYTNY